MTNSQDYIGTTWGGAVKGVPVADAKKEIHKDHGMISGVNANNWRYYHARNAVLWNTTPIDSDKQKVTDFLYKKGIINPYHRVMYSENHSLKFDTIKLTDLIHEMYDYDRDDVEDDVEDDIDPAVIAKAHSNGYTLGPLYHGTNAPKFTQFQSGIKTTRGILFTQFEFTNSGFFFAPNKKEAEGYGKRIIKCFVKITNILPTFDKVKGNRSDGSDYDNLNYIFDPIIERGESDCVDLFLSKPCVKRYQKEDGMDVLQLIGSYGEYDWSVFDNTEICKRMIERGYDAAKCTETEGESGHSYFIANPNNIKLADDITYDNNKAIIPLNNRFNSNNPDIRY
jgi:hypothetical protein